MRLLVVEDEPSLRDDLIHELKAAGFSVDAADNGRDGLFNALNYVYDALVLDLGLPDIEGDQVVRAVRANGISVPILILTARHNWQEKVKALELGADDYVVKPFHYPELLARLNALVRRAGGHATPVLEYGPIALNMVNQTVMVYEKPLDLTAYEYKVLEFLMLHAGQVISKTVLIEHIYDQDFDRDSNTIEVFIRRLRKKLDPEQSYKPIETLRGRGYRFTL